MFTRYPAAAVLTSLLLAASPEHRHHHASQHRQAAQPVDPAAIYSRRALRRARNILQLKLLELRLERLDRIRRAIERRTPIDRVLREDETPPSPAPQV